MYAFGMSCSECGKSSDNEENLCANEVDYAVKTANCDNEGDGRSVCSFILLFQKNRQDKRGLSTCYIYVGKDLFCLMRH